MKRWRWILGWLLLSFVLLGGHLACPPPLCEGPISSQTINPHESPCTVDCECNNQAYYGRCDTKTKKCVSVPRGDCSPPGSSDSCTTVITNYPGKKFCAKGVEKEVWGDCERMELLDAYDDCMGEKKVLCKEGLKCLTYKKGAKYACLTPCTAGSGKECKEDEICVPKEKFDGTHSVCLRAISNEGSTYTLERFNYCGKTLKAMPDPKNPHTGSCFKGCGECPIDTNASCYKAKDGEEYCLQKCNLLKACPSHLFCCVGDNCKARKGVCRYEGV